MSTSAVPFCGSHADPCGGMGGHYSNYSPPTTAASSMQFMWQSQQGSTTQGTTASYPSTASNTSNTNTSSKANNSSYVPHNNKPHSLLSRGGPPGTFSVIDPYSRRLHIPFNAMLDTRAMHRDGVPSLCRIYLEGRCRQASNCFQAHADPGVVRQLRQQALNEPTCCPLHGAVMINVTNCESLPSHMMVQVVEDSWRDSPSAATAMSSPLISLEEVSPTTGLHSLLTAQHPNFPYESSAETDDLTVTIPTSALCVLHLQQKGVSCCRFEADCKFVHICRERIQQLHFSLRPPGIPAATAATATKVAPANPTAIANLEPKPSSPPQTSTETPSLQATTFGSPVGFSSSSSSSKIPSPGPASGVYSTTSHSLPAFNQVSPNAVSHPTGGAGDHQQQTCSSLPERAATAPSSPPAPFTNSTSPSNQWASNAHCRIPSTQLHSRGPSLQIHSRGPSLQIHSRGPSLQLHSRGPSLQLHSRGPSFHLHSRVNSTGPLSPFNHSPVYEHNPLQYHGNGTTENTETEENESCSSSYRQFNLVDLEPSRSASRQRSNNFMGSTFDSEPEGMRLDSVLLKEAITEGSPPSNTAWHASNSNEREMMAGGTGSGRASGYHHHPSDSGIMRASQSSNSSSTLWRNNPYSTDAVSCTLE